VTDSRPYRLAVAGGGTGGHLFPGLAVAKRALASGEAVSVVFFGSLRGIEARLVPAAGFELVAEPVEGIRGGSVLGAAKALLRLLGAVRGTRRELRRREIDVVLGLGGYASAPAVIAARLARIPVVLMEQNREPGLANRTLARLASAVCTSFEETARYLPRGRAHLTGNPVRRAIEEMPRARACDTLLVFGGSAGAVTLSRAVSGALVEIARRTRVPRVVHQTGAAGRDDVARVYEAAGIDAEVVEFIDDMAGAYARAMLVVCRAGATTLAELIATGTPAVMVPYPHAAGNHQLANARALETAGAAVVVEDDERAVERMTEVLGRLLESRNEIDSMAARASALRRPDAAGRVLEVVRGVLKQ
jgi:UDP-N-acetylglucosamine--N-acetylmuramyl-(pentapeptide) pyrophosphoryl-undecaprenol N-acetylglucosamine transferase